MAKLIKAEFSRLFKNKIFWLLFTLFITTSCYWLFTCDSDLPEHNGVMYFMFEYLKSAPFAMIIFVAFFCGELFSSKTIKNLLVCGFSKLQIFFSELIVSVTATVIFSLTMIINGLYVISRNEYPAKIFFANIMLIALVLTVFTALSVLFIFITTNKAATIVIVSVIVAIMFGLSKNMSINPYERPEYSHYNIGVDGIIYNSLPTTHINRLANVYVSTEENGFKRYMIDFDHKELNEISDVCDPVTVISDAEAILILSMLGAVLFKKKKIS